MVSTPACEVAARQDRAEEARVAATEKARLADRAGAPRAEGAQRAQQAKAELTRRPPAGAPSRGLNNQQQYGCE